MKFAVCLPGSTFSPDFLLCWTRLLSAMLNVKHDLWIQPRSGANIYYVRNSCLGGSPLRGEKQVPFTSIIPHPDGQVSVVQMEYDYILWIDSDVVGFTYEHLLHMMQSPYQVTAGLYRHIDGRWNAVPEWDEKAFLSDGFFPTLTDKEMAEAESDYIAVDHCGMGFMLVKHGVYESISYPWHRPIHKRIIKPGTLEPVVDFTAEDTGFCHLVQEANDDFTVCVDRTVRLGHQKLLTIQEAQK